jgi:hypothetical protein
VLTIEAQYIRSEVILHEGLEIVIHLGVGSGASNEDVSSSDSDDEAPKTSGVTYLH